VGGGGRGEFGGRGRWREGLGGRGWCVVSDMSCDVIFTSRICSVMGSRVKTLRDVRAARIKRRDKIVC